MKKKLLSVIAVVAVAIFAGYNVYVSQHDVGLSDLFLTNVEALANTRESDKGCKLNLISICETSNSDHYLYRNR